MDNMAEFYKERLLEMIGKIKGKENLERLYELAQYLYIHKEA